MYVCSVTKDKNGNEQKTTRAEATALGALTMAAGAAIATEMAMATAAVDGSRESATVLPTAAEAAHYEEQQ